MNSPTSEASLPPGLQPVQRPRSFGTVRAISALALREMQTTYGRSPGGYIWLVLEPVLGIALLSFIFSLGFRSPALGSEFPPFYASGMVPFLFYGDLNNKVAGALGFSRPLLAYPGVTYMDAILARMVVNVMSQLLVAYVVFTGIFLIYDTQGAIDLGKIINSFCMVIMLGFGVGVMNCFMRLRFPIWATIWSILNRPLFLISCIFFLFETVPQPYQDILWYNPLIHIVGRMRSGFYSNYEAPYVNELYVYGVALVLAVMGLILLRRFHRELLQR